MAIYRTGKASLSGGIVTGYGTNWRKSLSLIRVGATIIFIDTPAYATIIDVVSDTELRVTETGGATIPESDYIILLHDSLSVDGLAQDVAETLRYYQGKENEFARFIDIVQNMDPDEMGKWLDGVREEADRAAAEAAKAHQSSLTAQAASTVSSEQADRAKKQVELAAAEVQKAKDQVGLASAEVGKAAQEVEKAKAQVTLANNASDFAQNQAESAADSAGRSIVEADRAAAAAKKAEDLANQFDATKTLLKDNNLSDLADKAAARRNLGVDNIETNDEETKVMTKGKDAWLSMRQADRKWGFWDEAMKSWHALGVEQGGTGAKDAAGARANIGVDRVVQDSNMTRIKSADPKTELRIGQDDWYVYRDSQDSEAGFIPLGMQGGGTGANDVAGARANLEIDRFKQFGQVTSMQSGNGKFSVIVTESSGWGGWNEENQSYVPLGVLQGGTGGANVEQAKVNLQLDRFVQGSTSTVMKFGDYSFNLTSNGEWGVTKKGVSGWIQLGVAQGGHGGVLGSGGTQTILLSPNKDKYLFINDSGDWGCYSNTPGVGTQALPINRGGTGATSAGQVRRNLGISESDIPVFGGIALDAFNSSNSGIFYLRNKNASGAQVSYSRIYNEIQGGVAKTTIQTTREGAGTNYLQVDETGFIGNVRAIRCTPRNVGGEGFTVGVVPGGAFTAWRDRPAGMIVEHPGDDVAVNVVKSVRWGGDWVMGVDAARYGSGGCEVHLNVRGTTYTYNDAGYASAVQWVNTSDIRLKANLKEIDSAKEKVKAIKGYTYFKRNNLDEDEHSFYSVEAGVIAQDVQSVLPEAVYKVSESGYLGVSYGGVTALMVNAMNEMIDDSEKQNETIARQENEIKELKSEIAEMKAAIAEMQAMFARFAK